MKDCSEHPARTTIASPPPPPPSRRRRSRRRRLPLGPLARAAAAAAAAALLAVSTLPSAPSPNAAPPPIVVASASAAPTSSSSSSFSPPSSSAPAAFVTAPAPARVAAPSSAEALRSRGGGGLGRRSTMTAASAAATAAAAAAAAESSAAAASSNLRVAVVGAGAAGLAAARQLSRRGVAPTVLERDGAPGGVWNYVPGDRTRPMYRGLRTNLPREVMAFRERPWGSDGRGRSYVTHKEVCEYLNGYAKDFGLNDFISYGCEVTQLIVQPPAGDGGDDDDDDDGGNPERWPKILLRWEERKENGQCFEETFDAVCVCNGHYAAPSPPAVPGMAENFRGRTMHSVEYDDPSEFEGMTVLCVGARASGSDLAREISAHAGRVYLSDSDCPELEDGEPIAVAGGRGNVLRVPRTARVDGRSAIHFGGGCRVAPSDVDVVIFCSGYDYAFPFIGDGSNLELSCRPGERRVCPLYEQLWHASVPSVAFVGLPHSVVPFPVFELQAEAVAAQLRRTAAAAPLPSRGEREAAARADAEAGGPRDPGRVEDTHFLGSHQWDYCRKMARLAGAYDEDMEKYIATNKAIYDHSGSERKGLAPGGPDTYRSTCYVRDDENKSFKVVRSEISEAEQTAAPVR